MRVCGIVAEYNPFHNGHLYQLSKARAVTGADHVVVVMSGNFVQRGEPAIFDKYIRTEAALMAGADMVLELPVYFATASAEAFASAAIGILHATGIVDALCFGSETGDIEGLRSLACFLADESEPYRKALKQALGAGFSYPAARASAVAAAYAGVDGERFLKEPNDILGLEYLKALATIKSPIKPYAIRRKEAHYHDEKLSGDIASATAIRKGIWSEGIDSPGVIRAMPGFAYERIREAVQSGIKPNKLDHYGEILQYILRMDSPACLREILDIDEGLEYRLRALASQSAGITELLTGLKTRRYTFTKLQRALLHTILSIRVSDFTYFMKKGQAQYIRVLGFRKSKAFLLKTLQQQAALPIILNLKYAARVLPEAALQMLLHEIRTTDIYALGANCPYPLEWEYKQPMVIVP